MNLDAWNEQPAVGRQKTSTQGSFTICECSDDSTASCEPLTTFPAVSIREDHELVRVLTEIPGVDADELEIFVDGTTLTLQGHRNRDRFRADRGLQKFLCRIELPSAVDRDRGEAFLDRGVLSLTLPKLAPGPTCTFVVWTP